MRRPRGAIAILAALAVAAAVLLAGCGSTNYNTDLGALAGAVEKAGAGHFSNVRCAGEIPYARQKQLKARLHVKKPEYRYYCKGEVAPPGERPTFATKVIRVSADGAHWHESKAEDAEANRSAAGQS